MAERPFTVDKTKGAYSVHVCECGELMFGHLTDHASFMCDEHEGCSIVTMFHITGYTDIEPKDGFRRVLLGGAEETGYACTREHHLPM